jgi:hypothetical protein
MDWETFLVERDGEYQRWVRRVLTTLVEHGPGSFYKLHEDERQWAERAVAEETFCWAPNDLGLVPASEHWPIAVPVAPPFEHVWLEGVLTYLRGDSGRTYDLDPAEAQLASNAVAARELEWELKDVTVRLPSTRIPSEGPYR